MYHICEMNEKGGFMAIRVLVTGAANMGKAGVATIVFRWGQAFEPSEVVYDYLMQRGLPDQFYVDSITKKGGRIYTYPQKQSGRILNKLHILKWIIDIMSNNDYKILHINVDSAYIAAIYILLARISGISQILVHSHCSQIDDTNWLRRRIKIILHFLCRSYVKHHTLYYLACSQVAGRWMFGKRAVNTDKYKIIYNGINLERFRFNNAIRDQYRRKMKIENNIVLINIGRFSYQKNHFYLLDIFEKYHRIHPSSRLFLIGEGELQKELSRKVDLMEMGKEVVFLGARDDIPEWLNAADVFIMPSLFEGLPVTLVEAQSASLPCVISDSITNEINISEYIYRCKLTDTLEDWCRQIDRALLIKRKDKNILDGTKFNINHAAIELQNLFLSISESQENEL